MVRCTGKHSYDIKVKGVAKTHHADRPKAYFADHIKRDVPLHLTTEATQDNEDLDNTFDVERVVKSQSNPGGSKSHLVKRKGYKKATWEPWTVFFPQVNDEFIDFVAKSKEKLLKKTPHWLTTT